MLEKISIKNFKSISDWQDIKLSPITLIYGPNSSGKTSIIQSLLLLQQTLMKPNVNGGLVTNGNNLSLGSYPVIVNKHNLNNEIEFKINYSVVRKSRNKKIADNYLSRDFYFSYKYFVGEYFSFSYLSKYSYSFDLYFKRKIFKLNNIFESTLTGFGSSKISLEEAEEKALVFSYSEDNKYLFDGYLDIKATDKAIIRKLISLPDYRSTLSFAVPVVAWFSNAMNSRKKEQAHPEQVQVLQQVGYALANVAGDLKGKFREMSYIGPLRSKIQKAYIINNDYELSVGKEGENIAYFLYRHEETLVPRINKCFFDYGIPYILSIVSVGDDSSGPIIYIRLQDTRTNTTVGPTDVGFGISQLLPILIEGIIRKNTTICVEQPEIHLHPKLQAELASFFAETCSSNQWIIETHSESLLLRIQKLLKNKQSNLKNDDVSIVYVLPTESGSKVFQIRLDENGRFRDEWPEGFFEERLQEILGK